MLVVQRWHPRMTTEEDAGAKEEDGVQRWRREGGRSMMLASRRRRSEEDAGARGGGDQRRMLMPEEEYDAGRTMLAPEEDNGVQCWRQEGGWSATLTSRRRREKDAGIKEEEIRGGRWRPRRSRAEEDTDA